jgi:hypothetical protein
VYPHRGKRYPGLAGVRGGGLHRLCPMRCRVPRAGDHAGGLPQGPRAPHGHDPLRVRRRLHPRGGRGDGAGHRGNGVGQRRSGEGAVTEVRRPRLPGAGASGPGVCPSHRGHSRPGAISGGAARASRGAHRRRRGLMPLRAGDGGGDSSGPVRGI